MRYRLSLSIDFHRNTYPGTYIALEGIDGSGKTTQAVEIKKYFESKGRTVIQTSEPKVDLPGGELIMQFFKGEVKIPGQAFQYWMTANRVINHDTLVIPALKRGEVVISDRCYWSAIPYGLMDAGVSFSNNSPSFPRRRESSVKEQAELMMITQGVLSHYHQFIAPDKVLYIDIGSEVGLSRSVAKKGRRENDVYEKKDKLEKVVKGYRWLVKEFPKEFAIINGEKSKEDVTKAILSHLSDL